jgi:hypothetical protein
MGTTKQRIALRLLLMTGLIAIGGLDRSALSGKDQESELAASVDRLVQAWEPIAAERRFDDIAWAKDIRDALRLGRQHNRPIFLFTYSGSANREHAMALQRC